MTQWTQPPPEHRAMGSTCAALGAILLACGLMAEPSSGQALDVEGTAQVSVPRANLRAACSMSAEVEILSSAGDWYRVRHPDSGIEGCMHRTVLGPVTPRREEAAEELDEWEEELREREAEAREAELEAERELRAAKLEAERERREAELEAREGEAERRAREAEWAARRARGEKRVTGYFDVNIGYGIPGEDSLHVEGGILERDDEGRLVPIPNSHFEDDYEYGGDLAFGVAGGVLVALYRGGGIGGGASLTRATYTVDVDTFESRPHGFVPGAIVSDEFAAGGPDRTETALHLHAVYAPPTPEQLRVRLFLGPTVFRVELPVVAGSTGLFLDNPPRAEITALTFDERGETVVGAHLGSDVAYFFSRVFGIGGSLLYSEGTEEVEFSPPDAPHPIVEEVTLGGLSAMFGVRFRF